MARLLARYEEDTGSFPVGKNPFPPQRVQPRPARTRPHPSLFVAAEIRERHVSAANATDRRHELRRPNHSPAAVQVPSAGKIHTFIKTCLLPFPTKSQSRFQSL